MELNLNDPFEAAVAEIVATNRKKRADYSADPSGAAFWNFERSAEQVGLTREQVVEVFISTKQARLRALTARGKAPENEAVDDTILDRAVYAVIAYAMRRAAPLDEPRKGHHPRCDWDFHLGPCVPRPYNVGQPD